MGLYKSIKPVFRFLVFRELVTSDYKRLNGSYHCAILIKQYTNLAIPNGHLENENGFKQLLINSNH